MHLSDILLYPLTKILRWYADYKDNQKWREFYARLDRNKEGRFDMKGHRKWVYESQKEQRKKNKFMVEDKKK